MMFTKKSTNDFLLYTLEFLVLCLLVSILYFLLKIVPLNVSDNVFINDIVENWSRTPITKIFRIEDEDFCPSNSTQLFSYNWEGTQPACDCRKSNYFAVKPEIFSGDCNAIQSLTGCISIRARNKRVVEKWKESKLCAERLSSYDYIELRKNLKFNGDCKEGFKACGVDTKKFRLCFPNKMECPINKVTFSNSEKPISVLYNDVVKLNDDWFMHSSNYFVNDTLLVDVKYSEGRVCINPSESNTKDHHLKIKTEEKENFETQTQTQTLTATQGQTQSSTKHTNHKCTSKVSKLLFDQRYSLLDTTSKFKFYQDNELLRLVEVLPHLNAQFLINSVSSLYYRSFIYWSPFCNKKTELHPAKLIEEIMKVSIFDGFISVLKLLVIIIIGFNSVFLPLLLIICNYNRILHAVFYIMMISMILAFVIGSGVIIVNLYTHIGLINRLSTIKCGDIITNQIFKSVGSNLEEIFDSILKILYLGITLLVMVILKSTMHTSEGKVH